MEQYEAARKLGHFERSLASYDLCERDLGVPTQIKDLNRCLTTCLAREHTPAWPTVLLASLSFLCRPPRHVAAAEGRADVGAVRSRAHLLARKRGVGVGVTAALAPAACARAQATIGNYLNGDGWTAKGFALMMSALGDDRDRAIVRLYAMRDMLHMFNAFVL